MAIAKQARIDMYFHCKTCTDLKTMKSTQRIAAGWTREGIQVVCENCGKSLIDIDFMGQKVDYYRGKKAIA